MAVFETLSERNAEFAAHRFTSGLRIVPSLKAIVVGCVDPRVDPEEVLGAAPGEVAVIRNVGGRITPEILLELEMLRAVTQSAGGDIGAGWELIVLHHTECGITRLADRPDLLAAFFDVEAGQVGLLSVGDPWGSVAIDVEALRTQTRLGAGLRVSGLVYDVSTGLVDVVVGS